MDKKPRGQAEAISYNGRLKSNNWQIHKTLMHKLLQFNVGYFFTSLFSEPELIAKVGSTEVKTICHLSRRARRVWCAEQVSGFLTRLGLQIICSHDVNTFCWHKITKLGSFRDLVNDKSHEDLWDLIKSPYMS